MFFSFSLTDKSLRKTSVQRELGHLREQESVAPLSPEQEVDMEMYRQLLDKTQVQIDAAEKEEEDEDDTDF